MMIEFLWHLRGSVALEGVDEGPCALDNLGRLLEKQHKPIVRRSPSSIAFNAPLWGNFFTPNWLAMVIYDHGCFWVEKGTRGYNLRYDLRSLHGFVFCLLGAMMFFSVGMANGDLLQGLSFGGMAFGWLYGMNILLALARVPRLIRKTVREARVPLSSP